MEIFGPQSVSASAPVQVSPQALVDAWKVGQLVQATAVSNQRNGQATISIGGTPFSAQTGFPLQAGQNLQLEVTSLSSLAVLKLINAKGQSQPVTLSLPPIGHLLGQWRQGLVLEAIQINRPTAQNALLEIAGHRLIAQVSNALPVGQPLKLEIIDPGKIASLRILNPGVANDGVSQALRTALPQQGPFAPLLNNLTLIAQSATQAKPSVPLPQPLVQIVQDIVNRLPTSKTISTADGLQQAVAQSGLFLEARLAQAVQQGIPANPNLSLDFKGGLLSLLVSLFTLTKAMPAQITTTPQYPLTPNPIPNVHGQPQTQTANPQQANLTQALQELLRHVETGLARLQVAQLTSSGTEDDGKRSWIVELPVRHDQRIDLIQLRIEKKAKGRNKKKSDLWSVNLTFDLKMLGPFHVRVSLANGAIHTSFQAENQKTLTLINQHMQILQENFAEAGLTIGSISAQLGKAPELLSDMPNLPHVLLDVKA